MKTITLTLTVTDEDYLTSIIDNKVNFEEEC
jgi:hypothetical protein